MIGAWLAASIPIEIILRVSSGSITWILSNAQLPIIFIFYVLQMFLQSLEPFIKLVAHLYERFTLYEFRNLDYRLSVLGFIINLPRLTDGSPSFETHKV